MFALLFVVAGNFWLNVAIRTFIGIGIGALCTLTPLYVTETVDDNIRVSIAGLYVCVAFERNSPLIIGPSWDILSSVCVLWDCPCTVHKLGVETGL